MTSKIAIPETTTPPTTKANTIDLYAKDVSGSSELFARSDDGTEHQITPAGGAGVNQFAGDGSDGIVDFDGTTTRLGIVPSASTYTLTRNVYLASGSQIRAGVTIKPDGWFIGCKGQLILNGDIDFIGLTGQNGSGGVGGAGGVAQPTSGSRYFGSVTSQSGGKGGDQGNGPGAQGGASSQAPFGAVAGQATSGNAGGVGQGGGGGANSTASTGASGGLVTVSAANTGGSISDIVRAMTMRLTNSASVFTPGSGGGGGRGGGAAGSGGAGGGGASGGIIVVAAGSITGTGRIRAHGGKGGKAEELGAATAGGGAGGSGGLVAVSIATGSYPTIEVTGGVGGAAASGGGQVGGNGGLGIIARIGV